MYIMIFFCIIRVFIVGGGVLEIEVFIRLVEYVCILIGMEVYCVWVFVEVLEIIFYIFVENVGLNFIVIVIELWNRYVRNEIIIGINVRKVGWVNIEDSKGFVSWVI